MFTVALCSSHFATLFYAFSEGEKRLRGGPSPRLDFGRLFSPTIFLRRRKLRIRHRSCGPYIRFCPHGLCSCTHSSFPSPSCPCPLASGCPLQAPSPSTAGSIMSSDTTLPPPPPYDEKRDDSSLEKGKEECVVQTKNNYQFDVNDLDQVQRKLKQRHVQMIAVSTPATTIRAFSLMRPRLPGLLEQVFSLVLVEH